MAANYLEQSLASLKRFEGCVPWMYRDTVGKITVGVGLMLPDSQSAQSLPFLAGSRPAAPQEIAAEFTRVDALPQGHPAPFYKSPTSLELPQQAIDASLTHTLEKFETDLRAHLPHYDIFPDGVKMALLDMIYNLGPEGLFHGFPHLIASVEAQNWAQAAAQCLRHGPSLARNTWTRQQFLDSIAGTIKAEAEGWITRIGWRLRHIVNRLFHSGR
jgi:GH24 family phage-related lysozyme (muramidase)